MDRASYLSKYLFDWDTLDVVLGGLSALDSKFFIGPFINQDTVERFLEGYGVDYQNPVGQAELFGVFQEALAFIRRYFLIDGNPEGLKLQIPSEIQSLTDINQLFLMATGTLEGSTGRQTLWAESILKVMHTILHVDKDLRGSYFKIIQTQIFDKFYKYFYRDKDEKLFLGTKENNFIIPLVEFETKLKKGRDSVIIKLLHKAEHVAEELFDRVGIRIVAETPFDCIRTVRFLIENYVVIPHNIKPSRSLNSIVPIDQFKQAYPKIIKQALREVWPEEKFFDEVNKSIMNLPREDRDKNSHTLDSYRSIQFTCRELVRYKNPFLKEFSSIRDLAKETQEKDPENNLAKKVLGMDLSLIARDVRFFYPYEVQVVDQESHQTNTEGDASHLEYKKGQLKTAITRVFGPLLELEGIKI